MGAGQLIADRFELGEVAGTGGMGTVWRGRDLVTGEPVAVKLLHASDDVRVERFAREARLLAELSHPALVRYVAHGETLSGERYLVMEWLQGIDLAQRLSAGPLAPDASLTLIGRAAEALGVAHAAAVVHRDIKPSNLFLPGGDVTRVKVLDFGVARWRRSEKDHTRAGHRIGTPRYMAPEQVRGARDVDARADVFALGCVLFACLTGRAAFTGDEEMAVLAKILLEEAPRVSQLVPDIPPEVDDLVARMLAKDPGRRPRDGSAVAEEIAALQRGEARGRAADAALGAGEKRLLSVVIARTEAVDDSGRTPSTELGSDITEPAAPSAGVFRDLQSVAWKHGGQLDRLAGGTLVATVAGSGPATDQAAKAARLALALRLVLPEAPMALATGSGEVSVPAPVGEVLERAAALVAATEPGALRIDDVTAGLLDARFQVGGVPGARTLAGLADVEGSRTVLGRHTPCVGRDLELSTLDGILAECVNEPEARAVLVIGGPGVGKSRVVTELVRRVAGRLDPVELWTARGDPLRAGSPFGLLAQVLRRAAGIVEGEPLAARQHKLRERVARSVPPPAVARVAAFLGETIGTPGEESVELLAARDDPQLMGDQIRRAWEELVAAECATRPVLLILEDLQWGDVPTVRVVDAALRAAVDAPFMVLASARPEAADLFPRLWEGRKLTRIQLGELSRKASDRLAREILGRKVPESLIAALVDRAAGNAFFLEELCRQSDRTVSSESELPPTILAMAQARLEELPGEARRVLRAASVFGRVFWAGGVAALCGTSADEWLETLAARELIVQRPEPRFAAEEEWAFKSEILREAALRSLTDADLVLGHRLAGEWLLGKGETDAMPLAEHFDRGGEPVRALPWFVLAAEEGLAGNDLGAVLERAERGLRAGAAGEALGRLAIAASEAQAWKGQLAEAEAWAERALAALPRGTPRWFLAAGHLAACAGRMGHVDRLERTAYQLLESAERERAWAIAAARGAAQLFFAGRYELGAVLLGRVDELAGEILDKDPAVAAVLHRARALQALISGDPAAGLVHWPAAAAAHERAGDLRGAVQARGNLANRYKELGGYAEAASLLGEVRAAADRLGLVTVSSLAKHNLGMVLCCLGDARRGRATEEEAIREYMSEGDKRLEASSRAYLSIMLLMLGEGGAAELEAETALRLSQATPPVRSLSLAALAQARLARGAAREALPDAREGMAVLERLGGVPEGDAFIRLVHARVLRSAGLVNEANDAIASARARLLAMAEKIADPAWRQSFLGNVPDNRETLALAETWLG